MAMGRPSLYSEAIIAKAEEYLKTYQDDGDLIPSAAGLALKLGITKSTIYDWASKYQDFSDMLGKMNAEQESKLLRGGLSGTFNATIAKLVLAKQGYSEKQEIDHTTNGKDIGFPVHSFVKSDE